MIDGLGYVNYVYNTLSQLTSESRYFNGLASYTLSYAYNLAGEVTSITNPWSAQVGYAYDKVGRPTGVCGSGYAGDLELHQQHHLSRLWDQERELHQRQDALARL